MRKDFSRNLSKDEVVVSVAGVSWAVIIPHVILMLFIIGFITIIPAVIKVLTTELIITNKRLYGKVGLINTKTLDTPLNKVNNVSVSSGLGGKIFKYGRIQVTSSSGEYNFDAIRSPESFKAQLMNQIDVFDEARIKKQAAEMASAMKQN